MNPWLLQMILGSLGLALAALLAGVWLRIWRRDPLASYRMAVIVLLVTLCMPLAQWGAKRWDLPKELAFVSDWVRGDGSWIALGKEYQEVALHPVALEGGLEPDLHGAFSLGQGDEDWAQLAWQTQQANAQIEALRLEEQALLGSLQRTQALASHWYERPVVWQLNAMEIGLGVYALGLLVAVARTGLRLKRTRDLLKDAQPVRDEDSLLLWGELMKGSPLAGRVQLLESELIRVPMCFGLGTPAVVLPLGGRGALDPELFSCVLLHELVHLERRDTWIMLGQEFARSLFWFHPAAWWLCSKIDLLRELSCDLLVVRRTGRRKRYATALVEYAARMREEFGPSHAQATALLPWSSSTHQLSRRIEMLVKLSTAKSGGSRRSMFLAAGSLFGVLWGGQLATAAAMTPAQEEQASEVDITELLDAIELGEVEAPAEPQRKRVSEPVNEPSPIYVIEPTGEPLKIEIVEAPLNAAELEELSLLGYRTKADQDSGDPKPVKLGITIQQEAELPQVRILSVNSDSLAQRAGLEEGDVIVYINGQAASVKKLQQACKVLGDGTLELELLRGSQKVKLDVITKAKAKHENREHMHEAHGQEQPHELFFARKLPAMEEEDAHFRVHDSAHTLPAQSGQLRLRALADGDAPHVLFIEEDGQRHEVHADEGSARDLSWFSKRSNQATTDQEHACEHDAHAKHDEQLGELHGYLMKAKDKLHGAIDVDLQSIHEVLRQATDSMPEGYLKKAHEHLEKAGKMNLWVQELQAGQGRVDSKGDSNAFTYEFKGDHDFEHRFQNLDLEKVRLKIREGLKLHPENKELHVALKALKDIPKLDLDLPEFGKLRLHSSDEHVGEKGDKDANVFFSDESGENLFRGKAKHKLPKRVQRVGPEAQGTYEFRVNTSVAPQPNAFKLHRRTPEPECEDCAAKANEPQRIWVTEQPRREQRGMQAELDQMRELLRKRQAELEALQNKLEALRKGVR